ncbi:hypothetical protein [Gilliamella sp. Imp1-1]|uniref:hypothetical protein n=1 Tax=Gilliamella sp. Imp1-1 TaxID=3120248 RepID=UPI0004612224|nr:hypothetical protein [Gilliamella apicola]KDN11302.1 hypothetical protein GAPWKB30_0002 [Gilliamella apicola]OCG55973.1 hypothetical protein A9G38_10730 [Gilliamella apicola]
MSFFLFFFPLTANAISVATAKTIKGNAPVFIANSIENNFGFTVRGTFYSKQLNNIPISFDKNLTLNDFIIQPLTVANLNLSSSNNYYDEDGDNGRVSDNGTFTIGTVNFKWFDNAGQEIAKSQYGKPIGCGSGFPMPLKLAITLSDIQVHSEYGDPKDSELYNLTKIYQINTDSEICFAKPNQMIVDNKKTWGSPYHFTKNGKTDCSLVGYNDLDSSIIDNNRGDKGWNKPGTEYRDSLCGGGYDHNVFDPINGFYASANPKFPTTGFAGAKFQLIMTGAQTDWNYSVNATPQNSVTVDQNGMVVLNNKPNGTVTISATFKPDPTIVHTYSFNPTKTWVFPQPGHAVSYEQAVRICHGESNLPTRAEMTNSPNASPSWRIWPLTWDLFTRAINQGLLSEWGSTHSGTYPNSNWRFDDHLWFYSSDEFPLTNQYPGHSNRYAIDSWIGQIAVFGAQQPIQVVCKG